MHKTQAHSQGGRKGAKPPRKILSPLLGKCLGHNLKLLDKVQKLWILLRKLFAPPGVISWLRARQNYNMISVATAQSYESINYRH